MKNKSKISKKQLLKACRETRKRVSKMSSEERAELLKRGMELINAADLEQTLPKIRKNKMK